MVYQGNITPPKSNTSVSQSNKIVQQSAGGVVYYIHADGEPRYLLIKRQAMSKKIERVCPKGKLQDGETPEQAALREVSEETGLFLNYLTIITKLGQTHIRTDDPSIGRLNKDITLYLMHYTGNTDDVSIIAGEGYLGVYKWCTLQEVVALIYYPDLRELIRNSYPIIKQNLQKGSIKQSFLNSLT